MELQGTHQFKAPLATVWDALLDPTVLSKALPGGDKLERVGDNDYKAAMNVRVGPVQGRFEGQVTLSEIELHKGYRMKVSGTGAPGFLNGEGTLSLQENDEGTLLTYAGDVNVGGRIASVGQRLIDSTAKSIIRQGFKTLDEQILGGGAAQSTDQQSTGQNRDAAPSERAKDDAPAPTSTTSASPSPSPEVDFTRPQAATERVQVTPPSATQMGRMAVDIAKDVAQDLASDYIPRERQPQVFAFIMGALAMLAFMVVVRLVQRN
jgi:carbon monoxide dehydrogenase subunit G